MRKVERYQELRAWMLFTVGDSRHSWMMFIGSWIFFPWIYFSLSQPIGIRNIGHILYMFSIAKGFNPSIHRAKDSARLSPLNCPFEPYHVFHASNEWMLSITVWWELPVSWFYSSWDVLAFPKDRWIRVPNGEHFNHFRGIILPGSKRFSPYSGHFVTFSYSPAVELRNITRSFTQQ